MCKREKDLIEAIVQAVAEQFDVTREDIHSRSTRHKVSKARLVAMALVRGATTLSHREIAKAFNRESNSTPHRAPGRVRQMCREPGFDRMYRHFEHQFGIA